MNHLLSREYKALVIHIALLLAVGFAIPQSALAQQTTATIDGTVTDATSGAPIASVHVEAVSPSGSYSSITNARGFYVLQAVIPDTYTLSFQGKGYQPTSVPGVVAQQALTIREDMRLSKELKTIATVRSSSGSNLVRADQPTDVYSVNGQQLKAVSGGDNLHKTLYQYMQSVAGVTANGYPAQPRIRGGQVTDLGYEFDGIPIQDRITGFFTSNLSNVGIANVEVYTGGLTAENASNGTGVVNSVVKVGTYPSFGDIDVGVTSPDQNLYRTIEYGGATPNHRFSYYLGYDGVNSQNNYVHGQYTFQNVLYGGYNGPGIVKTTDIVGNFHYKPDPKDDIQFLIQNGLGDFIYNYLITPGANSSRAPLLSLAPCSGNSASKTSPTGFGGGTAPNGSACPSGLYFGPVSPGGGNIWHHYSGIGKIQWSHIINDHSNLTFRLAENFNQYIFDQNLSDPNNASLQNPGDPYNVNPSCPVYPYSVGSPVAIYTTTSASGAITRHLCSENVEDFYGDRRSNMYIGELEYNNTVNANLNVRAGIGDEHDQNVFSYYVTNGFNSNGTWPNNYLRSNYPDSIPHAYIDPTFNVGKFVLEPGLLWQQEHYAFPGGPTVSVLNPTFAGTYTFNPNNVVRFSWGDTSSFVGTGYVYRQGSSFYNPNQPGASAQPQINHSMDLMLEHNFGDNTTLRFGPWYNKTNNYYEFFQPIVGTNPNGTPKYGPAVPSNAGRNQAFGFEFALNHVDNHPLGLSYWLSATYDNYWTTSGGQAAFINFPEPQNLVDAGVLLRNSANPLLSASLTADFHSGRFSFLPFVYYQEGAFYNVGVISTLNNTVPPFISQPELVSSAYWQVNATALERLGPERKTALGIRVTNLFENNNPTTPCFSGGTGCYPFNGPQSGIVNQTGYILQPTFSQNPRSFEFFLNQSL